MKTIGKILLCVLLWPVVLPILIFRKGTTTSERFLLGAIFAVLCAICLVSSPKQKKAQIIKPTEKLLIYPKTPTPFPTVTKTPIPAYIPKNISTPATSATNCTIKGNVNSSGQKFYHCPNFPTYSRTQVRPSEGDVWFCSEADAIAAGFQSGSKGYGCRP